MRALAEERPVALVFDGTTQAVMMATPADLEDFLAGFALTEGIAGEGGIARSEIVALAEGIEARAWLAAGPGAAFRARRRAMMGPVGCGLCGIDSIAEALRPPARVAAAPLDLPAPEAALAALRAAQPLHDETRATHAAGLWHPARGLLAVREDVGRHNALDKLAGAILRGGLPAGEAALVVTSRLSVDLVQKAAMIGAPALIGAGAATDLAVRSARAAGLALIGRARPGSAERYCERMESPA